MGGEERQPWGAPSRRNPTWGPPNSASPFPIPIQSRKGRGGILVPFFTFLLPLSFSNLASPYGGCTSPLVAGVLPLLAIRPIYLVGDCPEPLSVTRYVPGTPRTLPVSEYYRPIYMNLYLSTISRLLVMYVISSGTPNNIRSPNHITHNANRHRTLSVRTLRVRELCRHDRDTSPVNNQHRNLDAHIGSHIFYEDLYRSYRNDNIRYSLCHRYVTCPRFGCRYLHT